MKTPEQIAAGILPFRVRVKAGRAINDIEKLITPGIIYAQKSGNGMIVRLIAFGWWDWHVSFLFAFRDSRAILQEQADAK